ncbi:diguanylate cyclase [Paraglaciecola polaris]|uniref:diguanylate cyclase n=1 Tax=Paraglaciecola polaris TaxID=222814 RepID=UPI0030EDC244|tara:strand:+ start:747 stop:1577 length:831 start_codon:yes stop_codon:yes gene_type:complete
MFSMPSRWQGDWRMVLRNKTIELIETRLCEPLNQHMLRTSRLGLHAEGLLFLIELHQRKEFTDGFMNLAGYYSQSQQQKHRSHLITLEIQKAVKESHTDPLTGIANRRAFDEHIRDVWQSAIADRRPVVMFSADIDHFKLINDHFGHSRGDEILIQVAQCLDKVLSRDNDVVARVGGEEFAMVLPDTQLDGGQLMARTAVTAIEMLNIPHPASLVADWVTISLGCSWCQPRPGDNVTELIVAADQALYFAKKAGRNCASYMDVSQQNVALISPWIR